MAGTREVRRPASTQGPQGFPRGPPPRPPTPTPTPGLPSARGLETRRRLRPFSALLPGDHCVGGFYLVTVLVSMFLSIPSAAALPQTNLISYQDFSESLLASSLGKWPLHAKATKSFCSAVLILSLLCFKVVRSLPSVRPSRTFTLWSLPTFPNISLLPLASAPVTLTYFL